MRALLKRPLKKIFTPSGDKIDKFCLYFFYLTIFKICIGYCKECKKLVKYVKNDLNKKGQNYFQRRIQKIHKHLKRSFYKKVNG